MNLNLRAVTEDQRHPGKRVATGLGTAAVLTMVAAAAPAGALAAGRLATKLTSTPPRAALAGAPLTVQGRLTRSAGHAAAAHQRLGLYWEGQGAHRYQRLGVTRTGGDGRFRFTLELGSGAGELAVRFAGSPTLRGAVSVHELIVNAQPAAPAAPPPAPAAPTAPTTPAPGTTPAPVTTPVAGAGTPPSNPGPPATPPVTPPTTTPPPPPPPPGFGANQLRAQLSRAHAAAMDPGVTIGTESCGFNAITQNAPMVASPTGTYVWTIDELWAKPSNGSANWSYSTSGHWYWNGTARPVWDWYDYTTGQVAGFTAMDSWNINAGWTVDIIQYVWDNGYWYDGVGASVCAF